ncbi:hypothetical protein GCM10020295_45070 [Streptomyces cinereospinus]
MGVTLPRVANDQYNAGPHPGRNELLPGDLVFFSDDLTNSRAIRHVGIYVGGGYMINAPRTGAVIRFDPIDTPRLLRRHPGHRRWRESAPLGGLTTAGTERELHP